MVRTALTADDSLAAIRARSRFGMAMAAIIRMIATTISNSISEKPFCLRISLSPLLPLASVVSIDPIRALFALYPPQHRKERTRRRIVHVFNNLTGILELRRRHTSVAESLVLADFVGPGDKECHFGTEPGFSYLQPSQTGNRQKT